MEKTKNKLPYYLRIEKNKDGTSRIIMHAFRYTRFLQTVAFLVVFGAVTYSAISLRLPIMTICVSFFLPTLAFVLAIMQIIAKTIITLDSKLLIKRTTWHKVSFPTKNIASIHVDAPIQQMPVDPFFQRTQTVMLRKLILQLHDGQEILLLDDFEDIQPALDLCAFITAYYSLDEKPKTNHQQPKTEN